MRRGFFHRGAVILICIGILLGCAKVPKQAVQLSYILGDDITAVQTSYRLLVRQHFQNLRNQVTTFIDTRWKPVYLRDFIQNGNLVGRATGSDPAKVLKDVGDWAQVAIEEIESKKKELLDPIDKAESELQLSIDEAFARMTRANSTITAHLNSVRKVQAVQDAALEAFGLKDLRDRINNGLVEASEATQEAIDKFAQAEGVINQLQ